MKKKTATRGNGTRLHRHYLYTAAVQSVECDIDFFRRVYRRERGRPFRRLREDFCGTGVLAREWVRRYRENLAWGVDLHAPTLQWGERHYGPRLGSAAGRARFLCGDVLDVRPARVDVIAALNFSYSVFKTREQLGAYLRAARRGLDRGGVLFLDAWGGPDAMATDTEIRRIPAEAAWDGTRVPAFTYVWEQERFNPVDHHMTCHIHFRFRDGHRQQRAFTYDWRLWTLPELQELMREAGFSATRVYVEGWGDDDEPDGIFRRKRYFENQDSWVVYVVGLV